ncbi:MAG: peptidase, partial [Verrucomicrobiales bacterium]|nr:peptidase [Verrucomicrobiales bacterium]
MSLKTRIVVSVSLLFALVACLLFPRKSEISSRLTPTAPRPEVVLPQSSSIALLSATVKAPDTNTFLRSPGQKFKQLRNTDRTLTELIHDPKAVLLRNASIDTRVNVPLAIPSHLASKLGTSSSFLVQVKEGASGNVRAEMEKKGVQVVSYIPNNTWLVKMKEAGNEASLSAIAGVETVLPFHPYFKLGAKVLEAAMDQSVSPAGNALALTLFPGITTAEIASLADRNQLEVITQSRSPFGPQLIVKSDRVALTALANENSVQSIEVLPKRVLMNDLSRVVLGISEDTITLTNYLGLTGTNVLINVNDTGVDASHPDLSGRVTADVASNLTDNDGHGTHVAGIIASSGEHSPTNVVGSVEGANFRGKAPGAKLFVMGVDLVGGPLLSDTYLQETAASANALISNNSWGYVGANDYISASASYDAAVRDA